MKLNGRRLTAQKKLLENKVQLRTKQLREKNKEITDSINYAKRIQNAVLPSKKLLKQHLKNYFILFKPKDIVSGDFYWIESKNGLVLFADRKSVV